jgi:hypothetical protein
MEARVTIWHVVGIAISYPLYAALKYGLRQAVGKWRARQAEKPE